MILFYIGVLSLDQLDAVDGSSKFFIFNSVTYTRAFYYDPRCVFSYVISYVNNIKMIKKMRFLYVNFDSPRQQQTSHNLTQICSNLTRACHNSTHTCHNLTRALTQITPYLSQRNPSLVTAYPEPVTT